MTLEITSGQTYRGKLIEGAPTSSVDLDESPRAKISDESRITMLTKGDGGK